MVVSSGGGRFLLRGLALGLNAGLGGGAGLLAGALLLVGGGGTLSRVLGLVGSCLLGVEVLLGLLLGLDLLRAGSLLACTRGSLLGGGTRRSLATLLSSSRGSLLGSSTSLGNSTALPLLHGLLGVLLALSRLAALLSGSSTLGSLLLLVDGGAVLVDLGDTGLALLERLQQLVLVADLEAELALVLSDDALLTHLLHADHELLVVSVGITITLSTMMVVLTERREPSRWLGGRSRGLHRDRGWPLRSSHCRIWIPCSQREFESKFIYLKIIIRNLKFSIND